MADLRDTPRLVSIPKTAMDCLAFLNTSIHAAMITSYEQKIALKRAANAELRARHEELCALREARLKREGYGG